MTDPSEPEAEPGNLRFLRVLVTVLTAVMIAGLLVLITLFVIRFPTQQITLPDRITLPDGAEPLAYTVGPGWYAVVTGDNRILIYDQTTGDLRQSIDVE